MNINLNNFATPDWETTSFGDEMCRNLFKQGNERKSNKFKRTLNPIDRIRKPGIVVKSKIQKKQILVKDRILENVGKCMMKVKKMENRDKTNGNNSSMKFPHGGQISNRNNTHLPKLKYLSNKVKNNLERKDYPEVKRFLSSSIDTPTPHVAISKTNNASVVPAKNKPRRKKFEALKKHIDKNSETVLKAFKRNTEEYPRKSKIVKAFSKSSNNVSKIIQKIRQTPPTEESDEAHLFGNSSKNSRKYKKCKSLKARMMEKLKTSRFRYLNEEIYKMNSKDAQTMFMDDPESFEAYHEGYRLQVNSWPINPVDVIISKVKKMPKTYIVADFGCGEAKLSREVDQKVHSFDLVATNELVTACDMAHVPLKKNTVDVVIFCLSLMGTNIHDYLKEANRVAKIGGILMVAEVESRFDDVDNFIDGVQRFGYQNTLKDLSHDFFYFIDFKKMTNIKKTRTLPTLSLHPCLYKKR